MPLLQTTKTEPLHLRRNLTTLLLRTYRYWSVVVICQAPPQIPACASTRSSKAGMAKLTRPQLSFDSTVELTPPPKDIVLVDKPNPKMSRCSLALRKAKETDFG